MAKKTETKKTATKKPAAKKKGGGKKAPSLGDLMVLMAQDKVATNKRIDSLQSQLDELPQKIRAKLLKEFREDAKQIREDFEKLSERVPGNENSSALLPMSLRPAAKSRKDQVTRPDSKDPIKRPAKNEAFKRGIKKARKALNSGASK